MKELLMFFLISLFFPKEIFSQKNKNKPNVLFISVDDLNDFSTFQNIYPDAITPNIDKLAASGINFNNAHTQYPMCGPSRSSLMSGLYPTTVRGRRERIKDEELQQNVKNLGSSLIHEYFAKHGYKTMAIGKLCHYHVPKNSVDVSGGRGAFDAGIGRLKANYQNPKTNTDWAIVDKPDEEFPDYLAADWTINELNKDHEDPFMLMVGFLRPHVPWYVTKKWFDLYDSEKITLPKYIKDDLDDVSEFSKNINRQSYMPSTDWAIENHQWRNIIHAYLACVSFVDYQVGRVLKALENSQYKDNTIIVLWSDHGYHLGEKNLFQKHTLWERSSHVPLIFSGPGIKKGSCTNEVVGLLDIYPTLVDLCGLPKNVKNEGHSLVPLIKNPKLKWPYNSFTSWKSGNYAVQSKRYRYIRYKDGSEELYDHKKDPNEWKNQVNNKKLLKIKLELSTKLDEMNFKDVHEKW